ncbi:sensor histidine kinase [Prevotella dentalis DSM 3688]|uniref:Sensor histidine kinase n=1 Tax=Prevotella dentalis (strain ATCC 49559 / DSM 3688 / JCM 13448 / NCTC 12043 / ES 2772) TaxID=908937 RepID=F9D2J5_PREDD|nr:sensor histidine kinase [Prevotella dentalis DSM 3688]
MGSGNRQDRRTITPRPTAFSGGHAPTGACPPDLFFRRKRRQILLI